jgi:HAD superfamily hydrolase (TIGR01509 family)
MSVNGETTAAVSLAGPAIIAAVAAPFEAIVFDNDGLLLDTEEAWTRAEEILFARYGSSFTMEHKRSLLGSSRRVAAAKLEAMLVRPGQGEALMEELHDLVMEEALEPTQPRPGALDLLAALIATGVPIGLASNSSRSFVERTLGGAGLLDGRFAAIVTANDVDQPKPAPDLYLAACAALDADPTCSAALEDSAPGVVSAHAAGMFVIAVPYFPETAFPEASLTAPSLADPRVAAALGLVKAEA